MGKSLRKSLRVYVAKMKGETSDRRKAEGVESVNRSSGATLRDVDRFLLENFNSMYSRREEEDEDEGGDGNFYGARVNGLPPPPPPGVVSRPFVRSKKPQPSDQGPSAGGVPLVIFSKDPCEDFRKSMKEMLTWRSPFDWGSAEELFFRYLEVNDRGLHGHILRAFCSLVVSIPTGQR